MISFAHPETSAWGEIYPAESLALDTEVGGSPRLDLVGKNLSEGAQV